MQYKTITLELLQQQPRQGSRTLMRMLDRFSEELRASHLAWQEALLKSDPHNSQAASQALEIAVKELEGRLQTQEPEQTEETLDETMAFLRRNTPA